tara:strand:- start:2202 stop:3206 length:1005 start_codon:yes stop_codon:yes gene_type:complete
MTQNDRIRAFIKLRNVFLDINNNPDFDALFVNVYKNNAWFSRSNVLHAFDALSKMIDPVKLRNWISKYTATNKIKRVGVIIPSNIPLVGFYDFLCVLISGHVFVGKLAQSNLFLLPFVARQLIVIEPRFKDYIFFEEEIKNIDFLIFSGNNNSSKIIDFVYNKIPRVIRKNRNSVAVLSGKESYEDLKKIAQDIFLYFGFGCRNISKIFIPHSFDFRLLLNVFNSYNYVLENQNYLDNYNYQRTLLKINDFRFRELSNILLVESNEISSPISVLYFEYYSDLNYVNKKIKQYQNEIQCIVSHLKGVPNSITFGYAQQPSLTQSPDGVDVINLLI